MNRENELEGVTIIKKLDDIPELKEKLIAIYTTKTHQDVSRFSLLLDEYRNAPEVTRKRLWLDTVQQVLADNRKVVGGDSRQLIYVPMGGAQAPAAPAPAGALPAEVVMPQVESTPSGARSSVRTPRREEAQP